MKKIFYTFIVLLLLTIATGIFILTTETGLHVSIDIAEKIVPGTLQIEQAQGRLTNGLIIKNFTYEHQNFYLHIETLKTDGSLWRCYHSGRCHLTASWENATLTSGDQKLLSKTGFVTITRSSNNLYNIDLTQTKGTLNGTPLTGTLTINQLDTAKHYIKTLQSTFLLGKNRIVLSGNIHKAWHIQWQWYLPHISNLSHNLSGQITFKGNITGQHQKPQINATLIAKHLNYTTEEQLPLDITGTIQLKALLQIDRNFKNIRLIRPATLTSQQIKVSRLGLTLKNLQLGMQYDKNMLLFNGQMQSGKGILAIDGNMNTHTLATLLKLQGDNFLLANNHEYQITISPAINLQYQAKKLLITGDIQIPTANIQPETFENTVKLPSNAIVIRQTTPQPKPKVSIQTNITLKLGDEVHVNIHGLIANIIGQLNIQSKTGQLTKAKGVLKIAKGKYVAYGEQLTIEKGTLMFLGDAINNPAIDIRAIKNIRKIKTGNNTSGSAIEKLIVGIRISGLLQTPKINLFSEPGGLDDADILSYLLLGVASEKASTAQAKLLMKAADALGLGGGHLMEDLQKTFGLSELGFETGTVEAPNGDAETPPTTQQNTSFVIGKYITPKLYMNYSVGLMVPINILRIKYIISHRLSVQSESSTQDNGVDLFYTFETN